MPNASLGIQKAVDELIAVRLKRGWGGRVVDQVVRLSLPGGTGDEGSPSLADLLPEAEAAVTALPADQVFRREVEVPFTDPRRVEQAAPLEAEESLPIPLEHLICQVHPLGRVEGGARALVAAAPVERASELLRDLRKLGIEPLAMDVEAMALATAAAPSLPKERVLVLDLSSRLCQSVLLDQGAPVSFHAFSAKGTDPELLEELSLYLARWAAEPESPDAVYLSGPEALVTDLGEWSEALGRPVHLLPFPEHMLQVASSVQISWPLWAIPLGLALRASGARGPSRLNFLSGPLAPARDIVSPKRVAVTIAAYLAVLLLLWGAKTWSEVSFRESQYRALQASVRKVLSDTVPDPSPSTREVDQMRARVSELEERYRSLLNLSDREVSPLQILKDLSGRIPKDLEVEFRELAIEEGRIRIEGATTSYEASERVKAEVVASSPRFLAAASEAKDGVKPGEILFKLTVTVGERR
jgi:general secretion pathway protein L